MSDDAGPEQPTAEVGDAAGGRVYRVDVTGARGVLVGDDSTQHNYFQFFAGTWTDGVAPQPLVGTSGQVESPYRGLEAFRETDADFFFGRDAAIGEVLSRLSDCLAGTGLLVVSGVSGAGKTSLLRAGVLRELQRAGLPSEPEAARWPCVVLVPGGRPLDELALAISPVTGADAAAVRQSLGANPADFALTARQAAQSAGTGGSDPSARRAASRRRVLLVVDQFETVFTQCDRDEERTAFIAALCAAGRAGAAVVVIVIRADLEARLADQADQAELADAVQHRYLLGAMTERQLRLAITEPAGTVHSAVNDDLVAELLHPADRHDGRRHRHRRPRDSRRTAGRPGRPGRRRRRRRATRVRLQATVTEWLASGRDRSFLYSGSRLDAAARAADRIAADGRQTSLSREERAFLAASRRAAGRATRIRRAAVAGIAVLAAGLAVALVIATTSRDQAVQAGQRAVQAGQRAVRERNSADLERDRANTELDEQTSGQLASESLPLQNTNPTAAAADSVLAWALNPQSQQARYALQSSAADPLIAVLRDSAVPGAVATPESVVFSPDGEQRHSVRTASP